MPSPFYSASVVLFQLHGVMVSHIIDKLEKGLETHGIAMKPSVSRLRHKNDRNLIKNHVDISFSL